MFRILEMEEMMKSEGQILMMPPCSELLTQLLAAEAV